MTEAEWLTSDDPDRLHTWLVHCGPWANCHQTEELVRHGLLRVVERSEAGHPTRLAPVFGAVGEERPRQVWVLREVFGNPLRPVTVEPAWLTSTVVALARGMYESRDFGAMPILADALQDAGCEDEQLLAHCREPSPHDNGCWAIALVLGLE